MDDPLSDAVQEVRRLQRCMNDLVSVLALPAVWSGSEPGRILETLLDALREMLDLDFIYARVRIESNDKPLEAMRLAPPFAISPGPEGVSQTFNQWFGQEPHLWSGEGRRLFGDRKISIWPKSLGRGGELGLLVAGTRRAGFPEDTERLILCVAANQAAIGLQQALRLSEQRRVASELDRRVAERTRELEEANKELQLQVGLLQHLPVSAWTLKPDGTPDFVNQVWLEFSGQTLDFVRSHPEAWMTAVHPEDREKAARAFWDGVRSERGFAVETRSLRARDGTYRWHLQQAVVLRDADGKVLKFVGATTDIDDQKRAEEELRASEGKLRRVIDTIPTLSWCNLADGPNEFLSRSWHEYTGLTPEEAHGWGWSVAFHPDDLPPLLKRWQELLVSGEPGEIEARLRRYDGEYRWFLIRVAPFRDETGTIVRWYGTSTDIEDRKRAQDAVLASERNLGLIINTMPVLAWSARADGHADFFNQRWLDYTGLSTEQALGWGWSQAFHPDDFDRVADYWRSRIISGQAGEVEARLRRFDGSYRWFLLRGNPLRSESGAIVKWYGTNTDIHARKLAEEQVLRSEAFLAEAQRLTRVGSFSWRVAAGAIKWSEQLYRIFEFYPGIEITHDLIGSRFHPEDLPLLEDMVEKARGGVAALEYEHRLLMPGGAIKYLRLVAHANRDHEGHLEYIGAVQDVTHQQQAQEALNKARSELAHVSRVMSLSAFTASIAHEINQPLSGIITNASTCLRMLDASPPNVEGARETVRRALRDGNRASDVMTRLRTLFTRKEVKTEPVDLNELAREVIALCLAELQRNHVTLRQEFADGLPTVMGDRVQLQQVILNLLRNAQDAMNAVDDRPRELLISTEPAGEEVHFKVRDAGIGIDPSAAEQLFQSFYTTKKDGMGIGLSVSRSIIEAHDGRLWAMANDGPGATFAFSVPCNWLPETSARGHEPRGRHQAW
jgi:PAS domain S-box-containing protein